MSEKIAVVTGANKGIGFEICYQLSKKGNIKVILSSRDELKGLIAVEKLHEEGLNVDYHQLDVTDEKSIFDFVNFIGNEYGRTDILVNNAGVFIEKSGRESSIFNVDIEKIKKTMDTNFYGALSLTQKLLPLMKKNNYGRIVNVSSGMGQLTDMNGGYPGYRVSKTALNAMTRIMADELQNTGIIINTMCPGWVKTDMGGYGASRSVEEGADTAVWLALLPDNGSSGKFFRDRKEIPW